VPRNEFLVVATGRRMQDMVEKPNVALIADDDEFFRIALRAILLDELGFSEVIQTASLDEAIEALPDRPHCTLALFDLAMPGMESPASLKAVREFHPSLRVAVVSGSTERRDILSALEAGVHGYVPKGMGAAELASAIRLIIGGTIFVPPIIAELPAQGAEEAVPELSSLDGVALTPRQRSVLELLVQGMTNKEIARKLGISAGTIKIHLAALYRVLGVRNRQTAAAAGARLMGGFGEAG
jgi:DNA-binding NarL/FixJ family response regulator